MRIVLKNSLKNIFGKPFRTLLIVFAIFACCFCGYLCFDIGSTIETVVAEMVGMTSTADLMVTSGGMDLSDMKEILPEAEILTVSAKSETICMKIKNEYNYVTTEGLMLLGMNPAQAVKLGFSDITPIADNEILLASALAEKAGYKVGDKITVHDLAEEEVELTIAGLIPKTTKNVLLMGSRGIVNESTGDRLMCGVKKASFVQIDLADDSKTAEVEVLLKEKYPDASVSKLLLSEKDQAMLDELKAFMYLLFAIMFLLVIFVTASISNRIVSERMSFVGTLRSLGMSAKKTGRILILENVLYALLGSLPASLLYLAVREPLLSSMFTMQTSEGETMHVALPAMSPILPVGIILGAILIECLIPLRAILKALKTSIRDIIFDNRDTEYRFSRVLTIAGLILLAISIVTFFLRSNLLGATGCLLSTVIALALLFPMILRFVTFVVSRIASKTGSASWSLASAETISRKSTVGSGVLLATAAAMCVIIFSIAGAMSESMSEVSFNCDAVITCSKPGKYYSYVDRLDGVTETERIYSLLDDIVIAKSAAAQAATNEDAAANMAGTANADAKDAAAANANSSTATEKTRATLYGFPEGGYHLYKGYEMLPSKIESDTVVIDSRYAKENGYKEGDSIEITIHPDGLLPVTRTYTIASIVKTSPLEGGEAVVFFSEEEFITLFKDKPYYILINCTDPLKIVSMIRIYGQGTFSSVNTYEEEVENAKEEASQITLILGIVIVVAIAMTCIGTISNQLIGFTGRRKECAVMLSTAMSKKQLSGILFREVLITSIASSGIGVLIGHFLTKVIAAAVDSTASIGLAINADAGRSLLFFLALTIVFAATVLFPIRSLRKMKIAEQIKYE
ncbi:MAG: ABC transporter permease [Clostridiales bacterium]|nr:ABC transporter permease [Clostridiales bacterium]